MQHYHIFGMARRLLNSILNLSTKDRAYVVEPDGKYIMKISKYFPLFTKSKQLKFFRHLGQCYLYSYSKVKFRTSILGSIDPTVA